MSQLAQTHDSGQLHDGMELDLNQRGIQYTIETAKEDTAMFKKGDRIAKITSIPAIERAAIGVLSGVDDPPDDDAKTIYEAFLKEVKDASDEKGCTGCKRGAILRKYLPKMRIALQRTKLLEYYEKEEENRIRNERLIQEQAEKASHSSRIQESGTSKTEDNVSASPVTLPGSGAESAKRDGKRPSLLRRAAIRIKKIYRACIEP